MVKTNENAVPFYRRKWFLIVAGIVILLFAAYKALPYYLSYSFAEAEAFEDEIAAFEADDLANPKEPGRVLFIGSSSIRFWDTLESDMAGIPVIQRGYGGSMLNHSTHFADRIVTPYQPSAIVMYAGGNDMSNMLYRRNADQIARDFDEFVATVCEGVGDIPIIYIAIKPSAQRAKLWPEMKRANDMIDERAAAYRNIYLADIAPPMLDANGVPKDEYLIWDGLHLNAEGYALWTSIVRPVLEGALEDVAQPSDEAQPTSCTAPAA